MQFSLSTVFLGLATLAVAMPTDQSASSSNGLRSQHEHLDGIRWHVPSGMTVQEAQAKCGDQAQLSCCNKATYAGDTTDVNSGLGGGLLSNLIGSGSGAQGVGIFDQCSKLGAQVPIAIAVALQNLVNQECKQNIACCANSPSDASNDLIGAGLPCVALGSVL